MVDFFINFFTLSINLHASLLIIGWNIPGIRSRHPFCSFLPSMHVGEQRYLNSAFPRLPFQAVLCNLQVQSEVTTSRISMLTGPLEDIVEAQIC